MFRKQKPSTVNLSENSPNLGLEPDKGRAAIYDAYLKGEELPWNTAGCRVVMDAVLVRTYAADPFKLMIRIGGKWHKWRDVRADDPTVRQWLENGDITVIGLSPVQEKERQRKEEERQRLADERERPQRERHERAVERAERAQAEREWLKEQQRLRRINGW